MVAVDGETVRWRAGRWPLLCLALLQMACLRELTPRPEGFRCDVDADCGGMDLCLNRLCTAPGSADGAMPTFPLRVALYRPWTASSFSGTFHDAPSGAQYDTADAGVVAGHVAALQYANISAAAIAWDGPGTPIDAAIPALLTAGAKRGFHWAFFDQSPVSQFAAAFHHLDETYGSGASLLRVGGRWVMVMGSLPNTTSCSDLAKLLLANDAGHAFLVAKVFPGYAGCAMQPDAWAQFASDQHYDAKTGAQGVVDSVTLSPGEFQAQDSTPTLLRDADRWRADVEQMVASPARFQFILSFNDWEADDAVESAPRWETPSGFGVYLDALHAQPPG